MSSAPHNVDQLRQRIDSGETGEKVGFPDPAAAPLGTDAEAGGTPPTRQELAMDAASAPRRHRPSRLAGKGTAIYLVLAGAVSAALLAVVFVSA